MDPVHFTGKEVLEMAVRIEENGFRFYTDAGKASKSKELKELFLSLAEEEGQHIKVFTGLKKLLADDTAQESFDAEVEEASMYLRAIADTEVFTAPDKGKELARKVKDEKDALRMAMDTEKDSLLFYYEIQRMIREKDRVVIINLIEQEKEHLRKLTELNMKLFGRS